MRCVFFGVVCLAVFGAGLCATQDQVAVADTMENESVQSSISMNSEAGESIKAEKFGLLREFLKDLQQEYLANMMKILAFLILAIGWFVTSDKSREFFRRTQIARISSLIAVVLLGAVHIHASIVAYLLSQKQIALLEGLDYVAPEYYESYQVTPALLAADVIQNGVLFLVLIVMIYSLKAARQEDSTQ